MTRSLSRNTGPAFIDGFTNILISNVKDNGTSDMHTHYGHMSHDAMFIERGYEDVKLFYSSCFGCT